MNKKNLFVIPALMLGMTAVLFIPGLHVADLFDTIGDTLDKLTSTSRRDLTTPVRSSDERNLPIPLNYYVQDPNPDSTFTSTGGIDDIGDWSYPSEHTPHKLAVDEAGGMELPSQTRSHNERRIPEEYGLQIPQPDAYLIGGAPTGGLTYGWALPDNYAAGATRTILLDWKDHDHGIYSDYNPYRQILLSNPDAFEIDPYATDLTVMNTPEDFIPVYSTINGSVVEYLGADPKVPAADCPGGNCHGYGNFVRIRNSRWAAVNATVLYLDVNPSPCRPNASNADTDNFRYEYVYADGSDLSSADKTDLINKQYCHTGLITDDLCETYCRITDISDPDPTKHFIVEPAHKDANQYYKDSKDICISNVSSNQFRNADLTLPNYGIGQFLDMAAVKVTNYEVVLAYLTGGSVDNFFKPDGSDISKAVSNRDQVGTLGHTGFYWDEEQGKYMPNTDRPMLHYEIYYNKNCRDFGDSPNTLLMPLEDVENIPAAVRDEIEKSVAGAMFNTAYADEPEPEDSNPVGDPEEPEPVGAGDNDELPLCPASVWNQVPLQDLEPENTLSCNGHQFTVRGRIVTRADYPKRFIWQLEDTDDNVDHSGMTLSIAVGNNDYYEYYRLHGQAIPDSAKFGPVDQGAGPIQIELADTGEVPEHIYFEISFEGDTCGEILEAETAGLLSNALNTETSEPFNPDTCLAFYGIDSSPGTVAYGTPIFSGAACNAYDNWANCESSGGSLAADKVQDLASRWLDPDNAYYAGAAGKDQVQHYWSQLLAECGNGNLGIMAAVWLKESVASNRYIPNPEFGAWRAGDIIALIEAHNTDVKTRYEATPPGMTEEEYNYEYITIPANFVVVLTADFGVNMMTLEADTPFIIALFDLLKKMDADGVLADLENGELYIGPYTDSGLTYEGDYSAEMDLVSDEFFKDQLSSFVHENYFFQNAYPNTACEQMVQQFCDELCPVDEGETSSCLLYGEEIAIATMWKVGNCATLNDVKQGAAYLENLATVFDFLSTGCCFPSDFSDTTCPPCTSGGGGGGGGGGLNPPVLR
ncbi:MAG TPA: hypothetical protein PKL83_03010 [bacterium]|nr:hypothetical protein [bacterium]